MRNILFYSGILFISGSCNIISSETVHGNGKMTSETRNVSGASRIESRGFFDIEIVKGTSPSVKIDADENLVPYIITRMEDGNLVIRTKEDISLSSDDKIKVTVTTDKLEEVEVAGSGNITSADKFDGSDHLKLSIAGSGDMKLQVNTPKVESSIAGSGNITLSGETKESKIEIFGNGDYNADGLQSENVTVQIAGSGSAKVFSSVNLDVNIAGSGDVYYKGTPSIKQTVAGSGSIKSM